MEVPRNIDGSIKFGVLENLLDSTLGSNPTEPQEIIVFNKKEKDAVINYLNHDTYKVKAKKIKGRGYKLMISAPGF